MGMQRWGLQVWIAPPPLLAAAADRKGGTKAKMCKALGPSGRRANPTQRIGKRELVSYEFVIVCTHSPLSLALSRSLVLMLALCFRKATSLSLSLSLSLSSVVLPFAARFSRGCVCVSTGPGDRDEEEAPLCRSSLSTSWVNRLLYVHVLLQGSEHHMDFTRPPSRSSVFSFLMWFFT